MEEPSASKLEAGSDKGKRLSERTRVVQATEARGVIPEYMKGKVVAAPAIDTAVIDREALGSGDFGAIHSVHPQDSAPAREGQLSRAYVAKVQPDTMEDGFKLARNEAELMQRNSGAPKVAAQGTRIMKNKQGSPEQKHVIIQERKMASLHDFLASAPGKATPLNLARSIGYQLACQVDENHQQNIVHKDIKPKNVLLDHKGQASLADYGLATEVREGEQLSDFAGSRGYVSPEVCALEGYTCQTDIWSLGVLMYELLTGKSANMTVIEEDFGFLHDEDKREDLLADIEGRHQNLMENIHQSQVLNAEAKCLLDAMLALDPDDR
ncbi:MAG: protein kinase domain-containing protein, partial [Endozoicomonas sp.]